MGHESRAEFIRRKQLEQAGFRDGVNFQLVSSLTEQFISELSMHHVTILEGLVVSDGVFRVLCDRAFSSARSDVARVDALKQSAFDIIRKMESFVMAWPAGVEEGQQ